MDALPCVVQCYSSVVISVLVPESGVCVPPVRTDCGMFMMYCLCQLFCSAWMCSSSFPPSISLFTDSIVPRQRGCLNICSRMLHIDFLICQIHA